MHEMCKVASFKTISGVGNACVAILIVWQIENTQTASDWTSVPEDGQLRPIKTELRNTNTGNINLRKLQHIRNCGQ